MIITSNSRKWFFPYTIFDYKQNFSIGQRLKASLYLPFTLNYLWTAVILTEEEYLLFHIHTELNWTVYQMQ
jgi:hypothetical protein